MLASTRRALAVAEPFETPLHCGPYRVLGSIGSGAMGTVYEAVDTRLGRLVALKRLHPHIADNPGASERFLREGQAAARIRHPHVVQVLALGSEGGAPFLAMELLAGQSLATLLERRERLSVVEALDHVLPVIAAVGAAHDARVIHRDLKPSNVFVERGPGGQPWPKVVDFGVSAIVGGSDASADASLDGVVGTVAYLPPEQASRAERRIVRRRPVRPGGAPLRVRHRRATLLGEQRVRGPRRDLDGAGRARESPCAPRSQGARRHPRARDEPRPCRSLSLAPRVRGGAPAAGLGAGSLVMERRVSGAGQRGRVRQPGAHANEAQEGVGPGGDPDGRQRTPPAARGRRAGQGSRHGRTRVRRGGPRRRGAIRSRSSGRPLRARSGPDGSSTRWTGSPPGRPRASWR